MQCTDLMSEQIAFTGHDLHLYGPFQGDIVQMT